MTRFKTSRLLPLAICAIVVVTGIGSIVATNFQMKAHALAEAREKARYWAVWPICSSVNPKVVFSSRAYIQRRHEM